MKRASTKAGAAKFGSPLLLDWTKVPKVDVVVVASVAVALNGVRLGKGLGYAELEWAILVTFGAFVAHLIYSNCSSLSIDDVVRLMCLYYVLMMSGKITCLFPGVFNITAFAMTDTCF